MEHSTILAANLTVRLEHDSEWIFSSIQNLNIPEFLDGFL